MLVVIAPSQPVWMMPAMPAVSGEIMYTATLIGLTGTPVSVAACSLPPIAKTYRPRQTRRAGSDVLLLRVAPHLARGQAPARRPQGPSRSPGPRARSAGAGALRSLGVDAHIACLLRRTEQIPYFDIFGSV